MNTTRRLSPHVDPRRTQRRQHGLLLESLESRTLLSTAATEILLPSLAADRGHWGGGGGGGGGGVTTPNPVSGALIPSQLAAAYGLGTSTTTGAGETIAIVDAYNDPNIQADLAKFDSQYGLSTANLTVVNQVGATTNLPQTDAGWSLEIALDVEWAHAAAPGANILLVEANSATTSDLMSAVQTAAKSANVVSMSWGGGEFAGQTAYDTAAYFANPNVTFVAAAGDSGGATGAEWPASSPFVLSVGGTSLAISGAGAYASESAWSASGSRRSGYSGGGGGVSTIEKVPAYQSTALNGVYANRATPDVSLNADPNTGVSVYDSVAGAGATGWSQVGGTSAGAPVWAAIVAAADAARASATPKLSALSSTQTLNLLYGLYGATNTTAATYATAFHDVNTGATFAGKASNGYDLATGLGSPIAGAIITAAAKTSLSASLAPVHAAQTVVSLPSASTTVNSSDVVSVVTTVVATSSGLTTVVLLVPVAPAPPLHPTVTHFAAPFLVADATSAATSVAHTPPVQPLELAARELYFSSHDDDLYLRPLPTIPRGPKLFIDPLDEPAVGELPVLLANRRLPAHAAWEEGLGAVAAEQLWNSLATPTTLPIAPPISVELPTETDEPVSALHSAAIAGLAVVLWGAWKYRTLSADRDRRRWLREDAMRN